MRTLTFLRALTLVVSIAVFVPYAAAEETSQQEREQTYKNLELFSQILSIIQKNYVEEIDTDKAIEGAINGMLHSLDPHSSYLTPSNFQDLQNETQGSFTGIGVEITIRNGKLTVVSPIEGTPAFEAGLQANDTIVKIEGDWTEDMSPMEAIKRLRGPKGSEITFSISREGWDAPKEITLVRDIIPVQSVRALYLAPGIAYTRITNFQSRTTDDFTEALKELEASGTLRGLILDLRNNPGGLLNQAVSIADIFLDTGIIVYTKGRREDQNMVFKAKPSNTRTRLPLVVLVNEGSASASEIVAGAIQDQERGLILGTKTFGKGSVQTIVPLQGGAGLRMTTARYFTPDGRSIQVTGILPDVEMTYAPYKEPENNGENGSTREIDLKNHFDHQDDELSSQSPDLEGTVPQQEPSQREKELAERLHRDNQVQLALNILKGITLFSEENIEKQ